MYIMYLRTLCIVILNSFFIKESHLALTVRKFVHQKDISEHCRRRVVPSVFLGKHVMDANSQILHFSRLELPYSCSISVRTEFGNNIILVIQLLSDRSLSSSCQTNRNQLLIYELGETFGGYWGAIPDPLVDFQQKNYSKFYTLQTTPSTFETSDTEDDSEYDEIAFKKEVLSHTHVTSDGTERDFIRIDVPLVNISGDLALDEISSNNKLNTDDIFDLIYDVTPRNGGLYETSIIPLVQFSIKKQHEEQLYGNDLQPRYELDYSFQGFTPDSRITYNTKYKMTRKYKSTKRLSFRRKNKAIFRGRTLPITRPLTNFATKMDYIAFDEVSTRLPTISEDVLSKMYNNSSNSGKNSWELVNRVLKSFNFTTLQYSGNPTTLTESLTELNTLSTVAVTTPTRNLTKDTALMLPNITDKTPASLSINLTKQDSFLATNGFSISSRDDVGLSIKDKENTTITQEDMNDEVKIFFTTPHTLSEYGTGSLVNHKSFDNVVQAAPVIAVLLNKSNSETSSKGNATKTTSHTRRKRYIKALDIENARPRSVTTLKSRTTSTEKVYRYSDMQDLAQLVELQDDEIQGRVALRYLRKYVGSALFNICDYQDPKSRQVYLFNSSRIVIAVSNFTMERMTLVVTPARTLMNTIGRCPPAHLECQVAGTRVCIDSTNACDGVPNCGAYDIYDEDRLRCGWSLGLQHNVCLAACTFLAVLLTALYTVHYWLKRCVPNISEAFFVYTDASENTLFLDTIMRSPNDNDDDYSKLFYQANIFDDEEDFMKTNATTSRYSRFLSCVKSILFCKKKKAIREYPDEFSGEEALPSGSIPRKMFSFTEMELRDITPVVKNAMVQTGSSLQITNASKRGENYYPHSERRSISSHSINDSELTLLKLIRNIKLSPVGSIGSEKNFYQINDDSIKTEEFKEEEEEELHSTLYEPSTSQGTEKTRLAIPSSVRSGQAKIGLKKHLRFDNEVVTIPSLEDDEVDIVSHQSMAGVGSSRLLNTIEEVDERASNNDFLRFWRSGKSKKLQKKSQSSLR